MLRCMFSTHTITSRLAMIAAAATIAAGAALSTASQAHAGSNGQQVQLCSSPTTSFGTAFIIGPNQNGLVTASPTVKLAFAIPMYGSRCVELPNWWWNGRVTIHWYYAGGGYFRSSTCDVPQSYRLNTFSCLSPVTKDGPFDSTYRG
jgi:hypothetical protein